MDSFYCSFNFQLLVEDSPYRLDYVLIYSFTSPFQIKFFYRWIHSVHHEYHSPFSWVTQYLHPWELIITGAGTTFMPWVFNSHCLTIWSFMLLNIIVSVESHMGMRLRDVNKRKISFQSEQFCLPKSECSSFITDILTVVCQRISYCADNIRLPSYILASSIHLPGLSDMTFLQDLTSHGRLIIGSHLEYMVVLPNTTCITINR